MRDKLIRELFTPTNIILSGTRWPQGQWAIRSHSIGSADLYAEMTKAEEMIPALRAYRHQLLDRGALACEFVIARPNWNILEEIPV